MAFTLFSFFQLNEQTSLQENQLENIHLGLHQIKLTIFISELITTLCLLHM